MSEFYLKMISSNGVFYEGMCNSLIVPAPDGERAVMAHHEELMIAVTEGEARFRKQEGEDFSCVVVGRGYCQVANNRVVFLAETMERPEEIDEKRAQGIGVFTVDGKMIDVAFYDGAKRTIALAKAAGVYQEVDNA